MSPRALTVLLIVAAQAAAAPDSKIARGLDADIRFLASDLLGGRGPATPGDHLAQTYIATKFEALGLVPSGADGGYLQPVPLVGVDGSPRELAFASADGKSLALKGTSEMMAVSGSQLPESKIASAEVVFAGYGIIAPEFQWDDFKGLDVKGKVLLLMNNDPESDPALFAGRTRLWYGRWDYKFEQARKLGAAGAIIIHTTHSAGYPWQVIQTSWGGEQFALPDDGSGMQMRGWVTEDSARRIATLGGSDLDALRAAAEKRDFKPVSLGVTLSAAWKNKVTRTESANVLGMLVGSDRKLKSAVVVVTAHHDHLGTKADAKPGEDAIYNGAVDNASGVAAIFEIARELTALPKAPRRSILFAAVAAEEQGLLGSEWLVAHPPVPLARIAANVNIDGLNFFGRTRDVSVIGLGKSSIDAEIRKAAALQKRSLTPDQTPDRGHFYRSDQFNFAKAGVPATFFGSGDDFIGRPKGWGLAEHEKWENTIYHQPSDEVKADWDWSGAVEDLKLYSNVVRRIADAPRMPTWTKGDEFEAARLRQLSEAR